MKFITTESLQLLDKLLDETMTLVDEKEKWYTESIENSYYYAILVHNGLWLKIEFSKKGRPGEELRYYMIVKPDNNSWEFCFDSREYYMPEDIMRKISDIHSVFYPDKTLQLLGSLLKGE